LKHIIEFHVPKTCAEAAAMQQRLIGRIMDGLEQRLERLRRERSEDAIGETAGAPVDARVETARQTRQVQSYYRMAEAATGAVMKLRGLRISGLLKEGDGPLTLEEMDAMGIGVRDAPALLAQLSGAAPGTPTAPVTAPPAPSSPGLPSAPP